MTPLRIALVGAGRMGRNHARVIREFPGASLDVVVDLDISRAGEIADMAACADRIEAATACDAVVIASSTPTHIQIGTELLRAGLPCMIEKPLAQDRTEAQRLIEASRAARVPLMCGFVERWNGAITWLRDHVDEPIHHVVSVRHSANDGIRRGSVIGDLLIHDLDLVTILAGGHFPIGLAALSGGSGVQAVECILRYAGGAVTSHSASRSGQRKDRRWTVATEARVYELDLVRQDVTVYRNLSDELVNGATLRSETVVDVPMVHAGEPLMRQFEHFVALLRGEADPEAERATLLTPHVLADMAADASAGMLPMLNLPISA